MKGRWPLAVVAVGLGAGAQNNVLSEQYGRGVHAFFAGDFQDAHDALSAAIDGGTKDPRAYYFRAMVSLRLGNNDAAESDLAAGAELEVTDVNQFYPIGRSLERVQGQPRVMLEKYRAKARAAQQQRKEARNRRRYEQLQRAEEEVLRTVQPTVLGEADDPRLLAHDHDQRVGLLGQSDARPMPAAERGLQRVVVAQGE